MVVGPVLLGLKQYVSRMESAPNPHSVYSFYTHLSHLSPLSSLVVRWSRQKWRFYLLPGCKCFPKDTSHHSHHVTAHPAYLWVLNLIQTSSLCLILLARSGTTPSPLCQCILSPSHAFSLNPHGVLHCVTQSNDKWSPSQVVRWSYECPISLLAPGPWIYVSSSHASPDEVGTAIPPWVGCHIPQVCEFFILKGHKVPPHRSGIASHPPCPPWVGAGFPACATTAPRSTFLFPFWLFPSSLWEPFIWSLFYVLVVAVIA